MNVKPIPVCCLVAALWNPNQMDPNVLRNLRHSIEEFGVVEPLVVRPLGVDSFEVISGNHRLQVLIDLRYSCAPCVVVDVNDFLSRHQISTLFLFHREQIVGPHD